MKYDPWGGIWAIAGEDPGLFPASMSLGTSNGREFHEHKAVSDPEPHLKDPSPTSRSCRRVISQTERPACHISPSMFCRDRSTMKAAQIPPTEPKRVLLEASLTPKVNLAQQQNAIPLLLDLALTNNTDVELVNIKVELTADPSFCEAKTWHLDRIAPQGQFRVQDADIRLRRAYLADLREAVRGSVTIVVSNEDGEIVRWERPIEILSADQWGGAGYFPELVAAHCLPNDPAVERILKSAAEDLRRATIGTQLDGYQSEDRSRVWTQISAIYNSLVSHGIAYVNPPASFEIAGQKVRSPSRILETGLGTCLDLALFLAACLEQCGLNPLVLLKTGHAFVGCWLRDEDFSLAAQDDPQAIRKRVTLDEMVLVETTLLTQQPPVPLSGAARAALKHMETEDDFVCAIDIKRARLQAIRPVMRDAPLAEVQHELLDQMEVQQSLSIEVAPGFLIADDLPPLEQKLDTPEGRVERWKRKLLDLSLRNKLLNFKPTTTTVPIFCPDPAKLEDILADGETVKFVPMPDIMEGDDPRSAQLHETRFRTEAKSDFAREALGRKELLVDLPAPEMERRLVSLFRKAKSDVEEGGTNTLFLAIGFLLWTHADHSDRKFKAPLLLLPVSLERRSVRSGFRLVIHDDDPRLNPTLLQMLRQDNDLTFPSLEGELPRDHSGLDVPRIWQTVRQAIRDIKGWEITEEVYISTFSFTKHLMWMDLEARTDQLKQNPVVRHLIDTPREPYRDQGEFPDPRLLDERMMPHNTFCPVLADSSQLRAVLAVAEGKDFVLMGPPGTGKSQTITNMIAQCLAEGKTVLFVSEKMAALDVVYRRLREIGLGTFCLELHSSKARKLDVIRQLEEAWDSAGQALVSEWDDEASRLATVRTELNKLPHRLHHTYRNGLSPFKALSYVIGHRHTPHVKLLWSSVDEHSRDELNELRALTERLGLNAAQIGGIADNPFTGVKRGEWSPAWQADFEAACRSTHSALGRVKERLSVFCKAVGFPSGPSSRDQIAAAAELGRILPYAHGRELSFAFSPDAATLCDQLEALAGYGEEWVSKRATLSQEYTRDATRLDLATLAADWERATTAWWPRSLLLRRRVLNTLRSATKATVKPDRTRVAADLASLKDIARAEEAIAGLSDIGRLLGAQWRDLDTDWTAVRTAVKWGRMGASCIAQLAGNDVSQLTPIRENLSRVVTEANSLLAKGAQLNSHARGLATEFKHLSAHVATLYDLTNAGSDELVPSEPPRGWLDTMGMRVQQWLEHLPQVRRWCAWRAVRDQAAATGLYPIVEALEQGRFTPTQAGAVFEISYQRWWANAVVDEDPVLRQFVSVEHEQRIADFQELDARFMELTKRQVQSRLCRNVPMKTSEVADRRGTEWGVLNREINKKSRHMPLRKLIGSLPNALNRLTPCQLMSPLSIAQYLSPDAPPFDVVIFDEASQITVWDAIGAIARAKQTVVVGDPKQLPPTSFFARADEDGDEDVEVEDLESILDECVGASLPPLDLRWHYRSRDESLITFSNHRYYGGRLVTFPSVGTEDKAVSYVHIPDGIYEKGGARVNHGEAKAVVDAVCAWLEDEEFNERGWSVGVVTFNQQQQTLIEDLLDEARRSKPEIEPHFSSDRIEPVFVKNLESVQGDERDIILFSVTYGPDRGGRLSMNFGPLNRSGGERRLNVAITRARRRLTVYGTLGASDIDLSRTNAIGVRDFKHFLEFAEKGPHALGEAISTPGDEYDSYFEGQVAARLTERGWIVHPQVGVSGFRIDLGIVHPDHPGRYLAGVECDGATYHRAATARDRDRLREHVLRQKGWEILRVWSTDWWIDPDGSAEAVHAKLEGALSADRARAARTHSHEPEPEAVPPPPRLCANDDSAERIPASPKKRESDIPENTYEIADALSVVSNINPDAFQERSEAGNISLMIGHVVTVEGPIALELLAERIARAYGFKRTGPKITKRIKDIASRKFQTTRERGQVFFWPEGVSGAEYASFRTVIPGVEPPRTVDQVCSQELLNLARYVRQADCPLDKKELTRGMGERLGIRRASSRIEARLLEVARELDNPSLA